MRVASQQSQARMRNDLAVRPVTPQEYERVGELCVAAFVEGGVVLSDHDYLPALRDVGGRVDNDGSAVLVAVAGQLVLGTITFCPFGSPLTEICLDGEFELRMLAVDSRYTRQGVAIALIEACDQLGISRGLRTSLACVVSHNEAAHRLWDRIGFIRRPDRDWGWPAEGVILQTYTREVPSHYCPRCGGKLAEGNHTPCRAALKLEPPRYCPYCRRRMVVQVTPAGWQARCSEHGTTSGP